MKKLGIILATVSLLGMASVVSAVSFTPPTNTGKCGANIYDQSTSTPIVIGTVICGNGDPMKVGMPWGLTGYQTPQIASGTTVSDRHNVQSTCPAWYGIMGCFNLTATDYYENQMRELARQLVALGGWNPIFNGWVNSIR